MREVFWQAGWDVLFFAVPVLGMLLVSFSRLNRLITTVQNEESASHSRFGPPHWDMDGDGRLLPLSNPGAVAKPRAGCP